MSAMKSYSNDRTIASKKILTHTSTTTKHTPNTHSHDKMNEPPKERMNEGTNENTDQTDTFETRAREKPNRQMKNKENKKANKHTI